GGERGLDVIDAIAVPDRPKQPVGEAQHNDVLHRLLAEIVIDAENLVFFENAKQLLVQRMRAGKVGAERLFNDDPPPRVVARAVVGAVFQRQAGLAEMTTDRREARRRRGEIKKAIAARGAIAFDAREFLTDCRIGRIVVWFALHIGDAIENLLKRLLVDRPASKLRQAVRKIFAKGLA